MIRRLASAAIVFAWVGSASPAPAADDVPSADKIREPLVRERQWYGDALWRDSAPAFGQMP